MSNGIDKDEKELDGIYASLASRYRRKALEEMVRGEDSVRAYLKYFVNNWIDNMPWTTFFPKANLDAVKTNVVENINSTWISQNLKSCVKAAPAFESLCEFCFGAWLPEQAIAGLKTYYRAFSPPQTIEQFYAPFVRNGILNKNVEGDYILTAKGIKIYSTSERFKANYFA